MPVPAGVRRQPGERQERALADLGLPAADRAAAARRPARVDRQVADLAAVAGHSVERPAADDRAAADADLARDVEQVVDADAGAPQVLGERARGPRRWPRRSGRPCRGPSASRSPNGSSIQPRFGAMATWPSRRRTTPATATPTPAIGAAVRARIAAAIAAMWATTASTERSLAGARDALLGDDPAVEPDRRDRQRVDEHLDREHDRGIADDAHDGRRATGRALADGRRLLDEARRDRARRPARGSRCGSTPSRRRAGSATSGRRRAARGRSRTGSPGARFRCAARPRPDPGARFVFLSCKRVPDSRNAGTGVKSERTRQDRPRPQQEEKADGDGFDARGAAAPETSGGGQRRLRMGVLSTADIAVKKVIPGMRRSALVEVVAIASRQAGRAERRRRRARDPAGPRLIRGAARGSRRRRRVHPAAQPPPCRVDDRGAAGRQAGPVREAARDDRGRGPGHGRRRASRPASR